jgi:hypothetical protein
MLPRLVSNSLAQVVLPLHPPEKLGLYACTTMRSLEETPVPSGRCIPVSQQGEMTSKGITVVLRTITQMGDQTVHTANSHYLNLRL